MRLAKQSFFKGESLVVLLALPYKSLGKMAVLISPSRTIAKTSYRIKSLIIKLYIHKISEIVWKMDNLVS